MKIQGFLVYRIWYGDDLVYIGRTKQPLQNRIRGHLFQKPMHRTLSIDLVTKIEYAELQTEADMNLYEIYFILREHPPLNVDDKTRDYPTVELPPVAWSEFTTPLWEKWKNELHTKSTNREKMLRRYRQIQEDIRIVNSLHRTGEIGEDEFWERRDALKEESKKLEKALWGR